MSPVTLHSFTSILLSTNNMPRTVPSAEIHQWANRQKLCLLKYFILVRELDKKPYKLHTLRGRRYTYHRESKRSRVPGGGSGQKGSNFTYHGQRRTKKMTLKQRLEGDKSIWERALHIEEITSAKALGVQGGNVMGMQWAGGGVVRNEVTDIKRESENIGAYRLLEEVFFRRVRWGATGGFWPEEDKTWHFNRITPAAILDRL